MFSDIKKGDKVILISAKYYGFSKPRKVAELGEVEKVNQKTFIVNGIYFQKENGKLAKNEYSNYIGVECFTQERLNKYLEAERQFDVIQDTFKAMRECNTLNYATASKILDALKEFKDS